MPACGVDQSLLWTQGRAGWDVKSDEELERGDDGDEMRDGAVEGHSVVMEGGRILTG